MSPQKHLPQQEDQPANDVTRPEQNQYIEPSKEANGRPEVEVGPEDPAGCLTCAQVAKRRVGPLVEHSDLHQLLLLLQQEAQQVAAQEARATRDEVDQTRRPQTKPGTR